MISYQNSHSIRPLLKLAAGRRFLNQHEAQNRSVHKIREGSSIGLMQKSAAAVKFLNRPIVFTGGGSGGHVTPNLPLIRRCLKEKRKVFYIGSQNGIEKELIAKEHIPYFSISCGKFRRYFSWQNLIDPFKILAGIVQAFFILRKFKPYVIFSKGGFVSFPVVIAGKLLGIPSIVHESDLTPGLSNRLCFPLAQKICLTFSKTQAFIPQYISKTIVVGSLPREEIHEASAQKGLEILKIKPLKKILFVYGGSQGAQRINQVLRACLPKLLNDFYIIHICGKGKIDSQLEQSDYLQFEYLHETFYHVLACADLVISRSGSNTISELLWFQKPHILIPLSRQVSRGEQGFNARYFSELGTSLVLNEDQLNEELLLSTIDKALNQTEILQAAMKQHKIEDGIPAVYQLITNL